MATIDRGTLRSLISDIDADATVEYSYLGRYGDRCVGVVCASPVRFAVKLGSVLAGCVEDGRVSAAVAEAFRRPHVEGEVIYWPGLAASSPPAPTSTPTATRIELKRIRPGLYETVGHANPWDARTIEEIRPGHECHEQFGTGWMLIDHRSMVGMFDTLRDAVADMWEHMGVQGA